MKERLKFVALLVWLGFPLAYAATLAWSLYSWWVGYGWPPWVQFCVILACSMAVAPVVVYLVLHALDEWWLRRPKKDNAIGRWLEKWIGGAR